MTDATATPAIPAPAAASAEAVRCIRCDYDLRGLPDKGRCPECGVPVWRSRAASTEFRHAPPGWLGSLAWGAAMVVAAMLGFMAFMFLGEQLSRWPFLQFNFHSVTSLVLVVGIWLLTRSQRRFGPSRFLLRWLVRIVASALLISQASTHLILITGNMHFRTVASWFGLPVALLPLLLMRHAQRLALRLPRPVLARHLGIAGVGFTTSILAVVGVGLAADHQWFRRGRELDVTMTCVALDLRVLPVVSRHARVADLRAPLRVARQPRRLGASKRGVIGRQGLCAVL